LLVSGRRTSKCGAATCAEASPVSASTRHKTSHPPRQGGSLIPGDPVSNNEPGPDTFPSPR
jgi:hypothetical protein